MFIYNALNSATYICPRCMGWSSLWIDDMRFYNLSFCVLAAMISTLR